FDHVAAVAGRPTERVVPGAEKGHVVAGAAFDQVVAGAAGQGVVAVAAEDGRQRQDAVGLVQRGVVVAALAVGHDQARGAGDGRPPLNHNGGVIHENRPGRVAGDHDGVVQLVANNP